MGVGGRSKWWAMGVLLAGVAVIASVRLLKLYLQRRKPKEVEPSDETSVGDSLTTSASSCSSSSCTPSDFSMIASESHIYSCPCSQGRTKHLCARASVGIRRRIHYFERHQHCQSTSEQTMSYLDLTMSNDFVLTENNDAMDSENRNDCNNDTSGRRIDADTAIAILKRLSSDQKICEETMDVFLQWLQTPCQKHDSRSLYPEVDGLNIFITWYLEHRNNGHGCHEENIFQKCSYLLQQLSYLESLQQEKGLVWLTTSPAEIIQDGDQGLSDDVKPMSRDSQQTISYRPKSVVKFYQSFKADEHKGLNRLIIKPRVYQFFDMDWIEGEGQVECLSMPYMSPCDSIDRSSSRFINNWFPVCRSAARADYHVMKIGTRFQHLFQSRFQFYYMLNFSSIPVAGDYSYSRPF